MVESEQRDFADVLDSLDGIHCKIWTNLQLAANTVRHGWYLPVLGTASNGLPELRTVVLRGVNYAQRQLLCHTDRRSPKVGSIGANPNVSWLFYDAESRVQLRVRSTATLHFDDHPAESCWQGSRLESRRCYLAPEAPGLTKAHQTVNLPDDLRERPPTEDEADRGRSNFAAIVATVRVIDWLCLRSTGNLAARFVFDADGLAESTWLTP